MPEKKKKTTMSVTEMRKMLGLGKTDSYWLVHKNCFETIIVNGKMRIVIDSFEKWYANQIKHAKVDGPPPGEELRAYPTLFGKLQRCCPLTIPLYIT